jgi:hypothetical protein
MSLPEAGFECHANRVARRPRRRHHRHRPWAPDAGRVARFLLAGSSGVSGHACPVSFVVRATRLAAGSGRHDACCVETEPGRNPARQTTRRAMYSAHHYRPAGTTDGRWRRCGGVGAARPYSRGIQSRPGAATSLCQVDYRCHLSCVITCSPSSQCPFTGGSLCPAPWPVRALRQHPLSAPPSADAR